MSLKRVDYTKKLNETLYKNPKYKLYVKVLRVIRNLKIILNK